MTVTELLQRILDVYPGATPESMATFKPVFYARLRKHDGDALEKAATEVLGTFKPTTRQPFPIPIDFEKYLPSSAQAPAGGGKPLDIDGHKERRRQILADWRAGHGARAANGVRLIMLALEFIAEPIADVMAWQEQPEQLLLKHSEVKTAYHRAISQRRRGLHGAPPSNADVWWDQISEIAHQWGIETAREEWTQARSNDAAKRDKGSFDKGSPPPKSSPSMSARTLRQVAAQHRAEGRTDYAELLEKRAEALT